MLLALIGNLSAAPPKMKMTTEIPPEITISDKVETRTFNYRKEKQK